MPAGKSVQQFFGGVSVLKVCKFNTNYAIKFHKFSGKKILLYVYQKIFLKILIKLVKHSAVLGCLFIDYFTKELYRWEKADASVITSLMANIVWKILMPQFCIDFYDWENYTCTRQLLLNLIHVSKNK